MMLDVQCRGSDIKTSLRNLLEAYENLYREGTHLLNQERLAAKGQMTGLEEFYRMVQTFRRNKDVAGSLLRGFESMRPIDEFKIIEEDDGKTAKKKADALAKRKAKKEARKQAPAQPVHPPMEDTSLFDDGQVGSNG